MEKEQFKTLISSFIYINKVKIEEIITNFEKYRLFLQKMNEIHNLTNLAGDDLIYEKYFYESLIPYQNIDLNHKQVLDIGSGSGIPGIALKIIYPQMKLTIIEANKKKINFMKELAHHLGICDIIFINERAECAIKNRRSLFDIVTSRAVASLKVLIEISCAFVRIGGYLIEPKSLNYENELKEIDDSFLNKLGIKLIDIDHIKLENVTINTIWYEKIKETNKLFPREWKKIVADK